MQKKLFPYRMKLTSRQNPHFIPKNMIRLVPIHKNCKIIIDNYQVFNSLFDHGYNANKKNERQPSNKQISLNYFPSLLMILIIEQL